MLPDYLLSTFNISTKAEVKICKAKGGSSGREKAEVVIPREVIQEEIKQRYSYKWKTGQMVKAYPGTLKGVNHSI